MRTAVRAAALVAMAGAAGFAQPDRTKPPTTPPGQPSQPAPTDKAGQPSEQDAMMEAMKKAGTPGEAHKVIKAFEGRWNGKVSFTDPATGKEETSEGTSNNTWILGNRFLRQEWKGTFMGQPFDGIGHFGYDNVKKEYVNTWMDSMMTGVMVSTGKYDAGTKTFTLTGECADPMTGQNQKMREVIKIVSDNEHVMEMYGNGPDGKEAKMMTITYTRVGAVPPGQDKPKGR
jgi:hypothetical protein